MLARLNHPAATPHICDNDAPSADPTGTYRLRKRYRDELRMRWRTVAKAMKKVVVDEDFFGLNGLPTRGTALTIAILVPNDQKVAAFATWLKDTLNRAVIADAEHLRPMIAQPYHAAVARAMEYTRSTTTVTTSLRATQDNLHQLALEELEGIKSAVLQNLTRRAAEGIDLRLDAVSMYQQLDRGIYTIGELRTDTLVELMVVKAFSLGTLDQFEHAGVHEVALVEETAASITMDAKKARKKARRKKARRKKPTKAELARIRRNEETLEKYKKVRVRTAGDDDVCVVCEEISEGGPYTINRARALIPAHPRCRCVFVPVRDRRFKKDNG